MDAFLNSIFDSAWCKSIGSAHVCLLYVVIIVFYDQKKHLNSYTAVCLKCSDNETENSLYTVYVALKVPMVWHT